MSERLQPNLDEINIQENKKESSSAEKRDFLYKKIDAKIDAVLEIRDLAEDNRNLDTEELERKLGEKYALIFDDLLRNKMITKENIEEARKHVFFIYKYNELRDKIKEMEHDHQSAPWNDKEFSKLMNDSSKTAMALKEAGDMDLQFLKRMCFFATDICFKRETVIVYEKIYRENPDLFFKFLEKQDPDFKNIDKNKLVISFDGYDIIITADEQEFSILNPKKSATGYHIPDSVVSVIKKRDGSEETLRHEKNHNLAESFCEGVLYAKHFRRVIHAYLERMEVLKAEQKYKEADECRDLLKAKIQDYVYENFNEIIADIDRISTRDIGTFLNNFLEAIDSIALICQETKDIELQANFLEAINKMKEKMIDYMHRMANIFFVADRMGESERAKGAVILFKPKQMARIEKYFSNRYGKDIYEIYNKLRPLICGGNYFNDLENYNFIYNIRRVEQMKKALQERKFDLPLDEAGSLIEDLVKKGGLNNFYEVEYLEELINLLQNNNFHLQERDKQDILKSISRMHVPDEKTRQLSKLKKYFEELDEKLGIPELAEFIDNEIETVDERLMEWGVNHTDYEKK